MHRITPLRLVAAAAIVALVGGFAILLTFNLKGDAVFVAFLIGNTLLGLAGLVGFLGLTSLAVEIGVRAAQRVSHPVTYLPDASAFGSALDDEVRGQ